MTNHGSDKGFISEAYKELLQLNSKITTNNPIIKQAEDLNRHVSEEDKQMANSYRKRLTSFITRERQMKTSRECRLTPVRMAVVKKTTDKGWRGCGEMGTLVLCWGECKWKTVWRFLKRLQRELP